MSRRILLVEDEFLVGLMVENMLADLGHQLGDNADRLDGALASARAGSFDLALLDLTLGGVKTYPVADVLRERGIPFAFVTGHDEAEIADGYAEVPVLRKPFRRAGLAAIIARLAP